MRRFAVCLCFSAVFALQAGQARAADGPGGDAKDDTKSDTEGESGREDRLQDRSRALGDRIKSVQRKAFLKRNRHELGANVGATLNDAFFYNFAVAGNYTYHIRESF